jgi:hypothetical protein
LVGLIKDQPLKKAVSIALLFLFTFNLGGYYLLFRMLERQALTDISFRLDSEKIIDQELIEIKIPITLPYPVQEGVVEKRSGTFTHEGQSFSIAKQKYENDVLTVWCYRNIEVEKIRNIETAVDRNSTEGKSENAALSIQSKISQDFLSDYISIVKVSDGWIRTITTNESVPALQTVSREPAYNPPGLIG